jgi:Zn-dependent peptidase ImmA (M78 family)
VGTDLPYKSPGVLLDELGISEPGDILIEAIAEYCGATIIYEALQGSDARILGYGDRAIITVDSRASRARQRFSAAHELGHWMCDRGKVAFACNESSFGEWDRHGPEQWANRYAGDLLLPSFMFKPRAHGHPPTFATVKSLADAFETSLTATAIRLVELGSFPSMLVCNGPTGRRWFIRSPILPAKIWPLSRPGRGATAARLLEEAGAMVVATEVDADDWIENPVCDYCVFEDSFRVTNGLVLSLLWWKDESPLLDEDEE